MKEENLIELMKEFESTIDSKGTKNGILFLKISEKLLSMAIEKGIFNETALIADNLKNSINDKTNNINEYNLKIRELKNLINENEYIIKRKKEVIQDYNDLLRLRPEIEMLQFKHSELEKVENNIKELKINLQHISSGNNTIVENCLFEINKINKILGDSTKSLEIQLKDKIKITNKNILNIENKHIELVDFLSAKPLETAFKILDRDINQLIIEYNTYVEKIKSIKHDLDIIAEKYDSIFELYKKHHFENEVIFGHLQSREGILIYMETLNAEIKRRLSLYDDEIKYMVERRDNFPLYQLEETRKYLHMNE